MREFSISTSIPRIVVAKARLVLQRISALGSVAVLAMVASQATAVADVVAFAPAQIAEAEGYFASEGLDLKLLHCVNGKRCLQHLTDGEADLATVADIPIMFAAHAGKQFDIIASMSTSSRDNNFIARRDHGIQTVADLKGKRIGFISGTTGHYFTDTFLLFHRIDRASVTMVPLDPAHAAEQLAHGDVDAAGLYTPQGPHAMALLGDKGMELPNPRLYAPTFQLVARRGVKDDDLVKVLRAIRRAAELLEKEPDRAKSILARQLKVQPAELGNIADAFEFRVTLSQHLLTSLEAESRWAVREGLVGAGPVPDYLERMRLKPLQSIDARAVSIIK
jgi:ABC-type nitrate/sulfonate/bicarbonate transport system substrate-binding protein